MRATAWVGWSPVRGIRPNRRGIITLGPCPPDCIVLRAASHSQHSRGSATQHAASPLLDGPRAACPRRSLLGKGPGSRWGSAHGHRMWGSSHWLATLALCRAICSSTGCSCPTRPGSLDDRAGLACERGSGRDVPGPRIVKPHCISLSGILWVARVVLETARALLAFLGKYSHHLLPFSAAPGRQ